MILPFFHDVDNFCVFERCIQEEAVQLLLHDGDFQFGYGVDVSGLLPFVGFVAGGGALHHDDYSVVLFDVVAAADGILVPHASRNEIGSEWFS